MEELKGTNVAAGIVPFTSEDKYATHDAQYGKGGFRSVATIAERDAIPAERKTEGMVVRVQADKKHYVWESNAWAEWLPKGNVTVDTALNTNSNNAIANKVVTSSLNAQATRIGQVETTAKNAIPKANIVTDITNGIGADTTVPSAKAVTAALGIVAVDLDNKIIENKTRIVEVKKIADAAIPKSKIAEDTTKMDLSDTTQVPSSKAIADITDGLTEMINTGLDSVSTKITQVKTTADAAIPKANIAQTLPGNTTRQDLVPSVKLLNDSIKSAVDNVPQITVDAALNNTSTNPVQNKVITGRIISAESNIGQHGSRLTAVEASVETAHTDISQITKSVDNISTALSPIKTAWDKKNAANGLVQLNSSAKLPANVLPAGYDNVDMLVAFVTANPITGMTIGQKWYNTTTKKIFTATSATSGSETAPDSNEKIYINIDMNKSFRWTGSNMVVVGDGSGIALGTTASTAFRGDYGNTLYTNFGSGENLASVQESRDFFKKINPSTDNFIQKIEPIPSIDKITIRSQRKQFDGAVNAIAFDLAASSESQAGLMTAAMYRTLQELELQAFPLVLTLSGAGVFEAGQGTKNPINISVTRKGTNVTSSSTVTVTPPSGITGTLASTKNNWTPSNSISTNVTVSVTAAYGAQTQTKSISYTFKYKKYWGVSDKATLTNAEILALAGNGWADARTMGATRFDCSGGKYPYYIIPADKYTGLEVWVGGLKNTDLVVTDINLVNASGATKAYKVVRLANKQTGVLSVEFK